jgi:hypothetical protein
MHFPDLPQFGVLPESGHQRWSLLWLLEDPSPPAGFASDSIPLANRILPEVGRSMKAWARNHMLVSKVGRKQNTHRGMILRGKGGDIGRINEVFGKGVFTRT